MKRLIRKLPAGRQARESIRWSWCGKLASWYRLMQRVEQLAIGKTSARWKWTSVTNEDHLLMRFWWTDHRSNEFRYEAIVLLTRNSKGRTPPKTDASLESCSKCHNFRDGGASIPLKLRMCIKLTELALQPRFKLQLRSLFSNFLLVLVDKFFIYFFGSYVVLLEKHDILLTRFWYLNWYCLSPTYILAPPQTGSRYFQTPLETGKKISLNREQTQSAN